MIQDLFSNGIVRLYHISTTHGDDGQYHRVDISESGGLICLGEEEKNMNFGSL